MRFRPLYLAAGLEVIPVCTRQHNSQNLPRAAGPKVGCTSRVPGRFSGFAKSFPTTAVYSQMQPAVFLANVLGQRAQVFPTAEDSRAQPFTAEDSDLDQKKHKVPEASAESCRFAVWCLCPVLAQTLLPEQRVGFNSGSGADWRNQALCGGGEE